MVRIRISDRERELLNLCLNNKIIADSIQIIESEVVISNNDLNVLETIIDSILAYFLEKGLENNDEPNKLGLELENLNTKFIREVQIINNKIIETDKNRKFKNK